MFAVSKSSAIRNIINLSVPPPSDISSGKSKFLVDANVHLCLSCVDESNAGSEVHLKTKFLALQHGVRKWLNGKQTVNPEGMKLKACTLLRRPFDEGR